MRRLLSSGDRLTKFCITDSLNVYLRSYKCLYKIVKTTYTKVEVMYKQVILSILIYALCPFLLNGQDIEGVEMGTQVSDSFIKKKFGADCLTERYTLPLKSEEYVEVNDSTGYYRYNASIKCGTMYVYGEDTLFLDKQSRLVLAKLNSKRFSVDKKHISGGYRIGEEYCEKKLKKCGILQYCNDLVLIVDKEDIVMTERIFIHDNTIFSIQLSFPYGDDVEGVGIGELVSRKVIKQKFGVPYKVEAKEFMYIPSFIYTYMDNGIESVLVFSKKGRLLKYEINSPIFKTFTETIPGGLSVGDNIEKASTLFDSNGIYKLLDDAFDRPYIMVVDGKVSCIEYVLMD